MPENILVLCVTVQTSNMTEILVRENGQSHDIGNVKGDSCMVRENGIVLGKTWGSHDIHQDERVLCML